VDYSGREYSWLLKRLEAVKAALVDDPFNRNQIAEKVVLTKEISLRTHLVVAVCDGEETIIGRWRSAADCAKSAQLRGNALDTDYPVEGTDKVVRFIAKPVG
jgi:hypothetical protein